MSLSLIAHSYKIEDDSDHSDEEGNDAESNLLLDLKSDPRSEDGLPEKNDFDVSFEEGGYYADDDGLSDSSIPTTTAPPQLSPQDNKQLDDENRGIGDVHNANSEGEVGNLKYSAGETFKCPYCLISFAGNWILIRHLRISHNGLHSNPNGGNGNGNNGMPVKTTESKQVASQSKPENTIIAKSSPNPEEKNISKRKVAASHKRLLSKSQKRALKPGQPGKCPKCNLTFNQIHNLKRHMKVHSEKDRPLKCIQCDSFFLNLTTLRVHENMAHNRQEGESMIPCRICGKVLSYGKFKVHMRTHTLERPFPCPSCGIRFRQVGHAKNHLRSVHGQNMPTSALRSLQIVTKFDTTSEMDIKAEKNETSSSPYMLLNPVAEMPNHDKEAEKNSHCQGQAFKCPYCLDRFLECGTFIKHLQIHRKGKPETASIKCAKNTDDNNANKKTTRFKCQPCSASFHSGTDLRRHMKIHEETHRPLKYSKCSSYFNTVSTLRIHENTIHNRKMGSTPCPCKLCGKIFWAPSKLTTHMKGVHRIENNRNLVLASPSRHFSSSTIDHPIALDAWLTGKFKLRPCKVVLTRCDHLLQTPNSTNNSTNNLDNKNLDSSLIEIRKVAGRTNFICKICGKKFQHKYLALRHILNHTQERPHKCPDCSKTFRWSSNLTVHRHIHSGVKRFKCALCPRAFITKDESQLHLRVHTGERPLECPHCSKRFRFGPNLRVHVKSLHS